MPPATLLAPPSVRALAWDLLGTAVRTHLGPAAWDALAAEAGRPQERARDPFERVPLAAFDEVLRLLATRHGEGALRDAGAGFAQAWAASYRSMAHRLQGDPRALLEVLADEALPWFLDAPGAVRVHDAGPFSAVVEVNTPLPPAFVEGLLLGAVAAAGAPGARVARDGPRHAVTWEHAPASASPLRALRQVARLPWLAAALVPVAVGAALAWRDGFLDPSFLGLTFLGVGLFQLGSGAANDYFDHRSRADEANPTPTPYSGGSRVVQQGLVRPRTLLALAGALLLAGVATGLLIASGLPAARGAGLAEVLGLGAVGLALGVLYTMPPVSLAARGLGQLAIGLGFGPLVVAGTYLVQRIAAGGSAAVTPEALAFSVPIGALMAAVLTMHEVPDAPWDARAGKRTLTVRVRHRAPAMFGALVVLAYASLAAAALASGALPALLGLATAPLAWHAWRLLRRHPSQPYRLVPANATTVAMHLLTGLLLVAGLVLARGLGA